MPEPARRTNLRSVSGAAARAAPTPQTDPAQSGPQIRLGAGDRIVVERTQRTGYSFVGREGYYLMSKELTAKLPQMGLTHTETDVFLHALGHQERGGVLHVKHSELAEALGVDRSDIGKALRRLAKIGLLWQEKRGVLRINPRCAFYGRSGEQIEAVAEIPDHVPEIHLPDHKVRPPRRRRQLKGDR